MRSAAVTGLLLIFVSATASAQFSITPQVGFEQAKTSVRYNGLPSFSPLGWQGSLKAALKADYRFKKGFGPYASISSRPAVVAFSFPNPSDAVNNYKAVTQSLQWQVEGGYQFTSKPLLLKKGTAKNAQPAEYRRSTCSGYAHHSCSGEKSRQTLQRKENNNLNLRLQPSLGIAYVPFAKDDFEAAGTNIQYNAGNWKTAVVPAIGFEFDKGRQRLLTLNVFYTKGITNLDTKTFTKIENGKPGSGSFSSSTSSWGMTVGVPFSIIKHKATIAPEVQKKATNSRCGEYRSHCVKHI
jgi:hypothetical protein